jgi:phage virion morphogenesis protein
MITLQLKMADTEAALARLQDGLGDLSELMDGIGSNLAASTQDRIWRSLGAPDGSAWAAKSPFTASRDPRPLMDSGDMSRGIYHGYGRDYAEVGSVAQQSRILHYGAVVGAFGATQSGRPIPFGTIPARPFIGLSDSDRSGIAEALQDWASALLGK